MNSQFRNWSDIRIFLAVYRVNGKVFCKVPRSSKEDIELALDKAHDAITRLAEASPLLPKKAL